MVQALVSDNDVVGFCWLPIIEISLFSKYMFFNLQVLGVFYPTLQQYLVYIHAVDSEGGHIVIDKAARKACFHVAITGAEAYDFYRPAWKTFEVFLGV